MGWWKSEHGVIGDSPADVMDVALRKIEAAYLEECGRLPTQGELANLIEFCTCGVLRPACGDAKHPFCTGALAEEETPRAAERGAQGIFGESAKPASGGLINVDPTTGEHYGAQETEDAP